MHRSNQEEVAKIVLNKEENAAVSQHYSRDDMAALWQNIVKFHSDIFPSLLKLAQVALLLPVHTADVERGFSSQNCILTPKRNRLAINTQNMLMKVKMEGEKERKAEYIGRIVQKWGQTTTTTTTKNRGIFFTEQFYRCILPFVLFQVNEEEDFRRDIDIDDLMSTFC